MSDQFHSTGRHNGKSTERAARRSSSRVTVEGDADQRSDPIHDFRQSIKGLGEAITQFGQARMDGMRVTAQDLALKAALGIVGALCAAAFAVVCMVLFLLGLAGGVARLFNAPLWVGFLIVGGLCIGATLVIAIISVRRIKRQWLNQLRDKYAGTTEIQCKQ